MLLRDVDAGLEVLLLRRNSQAAFVPDVYVFPGGRVDASDADPAALARIEGLTHGAAADRLGLSNVDPPAIAYYLAAFREAFEETGILVGSGSDGSPPPTAAGDPAIEEMRDQLMEGRVGFTEILARTDCRISGNSLLYFAHWITPRSLPRRFDTRFFAAQVPGSSVPIVDPREMTDARWITPAQALAEHIAGDLPMITPTVHSLERLETHSTATEALEALALGPVVTILPDG